MGVPPLRFTPSPRPTRHRHGRILTGDEFMAGHIPPVWLIRGIVQRGRLYACTSPTSHGKTAVWLFNACMIQAGRDIGNLHTTKGNVLYLAGENPTDLEARMHAMTMHYKLKPHQKPYILPNAFPMTDEECEELRYEIGDVGVPFSLIVGDTAASFFPSDDENDNVQAGAYARTLRALHMCDGNPAVVMLCHPIKTPDRKNLRPRGGGAWLNELDGNLVLWTDDKEITVLHWQDKIRGPDFPPLSYRLRSVPTGLMDEDDVAEFSVVAEPIGEEEAANHAKQNLSNEDALLLAMRTMPDASLAALASHLGWVNDANEPLRAKAQRARVNLEDAGLLDRPRKGAPLRVSKKGLDYLDTLFP